MKKLQSRGAAMVEYGMLIGLVAVASIGAVYATGERVEVAICTPASELADKMGGEKNPRCLFDPQDKIKLKDDERFVDAPVTTDSDFTDVMFENNEIGERVILATLSEPSPESFWLDTEISSQDDYEKNRVISSCYALDEGIDPICSSKGSSASISVPANARAIGYSVVLNDRTDMPLSNDVNISTPGNETVAAQTWDIEVARMAPDPVVGEMTFAFSDPYYYAKDDTSWTFGEFVELQGFTNQHLTFKIADEGGPTRKRKICYRMTSAGEATCSDEISNGANTSLSVPPGAAELGYEVELPGIQKGPDWTVFENFALSYAGSDLHSQSISVVRPNEEAKYGALAGAFSDFTFNQTDTGWMEGEFLALTGERNVSTTFTMSNENGSFYRRVCYREDPNGENQCGEEDSPVLSSNSSVSVTVPVEATMVGYMVQLPDEEVGADWVYAETLAITNILEETSVTLTRPNEAPQYGALSEPFADHTFAQSDSGWTEGQFIELTGLRNTSQHLSLSGNGSNFSRQACYKVGETGEAICGETGNTMNASSSASVTVPTEATHVGYKISLPATTTGDDWTRPETISLTGNGTVDITLTRPNEKISYGSVSGSFTDHTFAKTDEGWTEGPFLTLTGERNKTLSVRLLGNQGYRERKACYKLEGDPTPKCGDPKSGAFGNNQATVSVPLDATEIGYMVNLPAVTTGDNWTYDDVLDVPGLISTTEITITRPNDPKIYGSMESNFTDFSFAKTDTGWTEGQFIKLSGQRNTEMTLYLAGDEGNYYKQACYKLVEGGEAICGDERRSGDSVNYRASVDVPIDAVEVGYKIQLPAQSYGNNTIYNESIYIAGFTSPTPVTLTRPNDPKEYGSLQEDFGTHYFQSSDTGWTEGQFVTLVGDRNVAFDMTLSASSGSFYRMVCYKDTIGGEPNCGDVKRASGYSSSQYTARHTIPLTAVQVGYMVQLPSVTTDQDMVYNDKISITGMKTQSGGNYSNLSVQFRRPGIAP